jgi:hypothetical protein
MRGNPLDRAALMHVCIQGNPLDIAALTKELVAGGMVITRATVKPSRTQRGHNEHMMWVAAADSVAPVDPHVLAAACRRAGLVDHDANGGGSPGAHSTVTSNTTGRPPPPALPASCSTRAKSWFAVMEPGDEWGVGSAGSSSSAQSRIGR